MLAGHTHGGQIRFPGVGAVLAPSIFGTRYAAGLFYEAPTLMHVSRGVSGLTPVRYNCRPEITLLRLVATSARRETTTPRWMPKKRLHPAHSPGFRSIKRAE